MVRLIRFLAFNRPADLAAQMYTDPACKPWTSATWAPAGYTDRKDLEEQVRAAEAQKPLVAATEEMTEDIKA